MKAQFDLRPAEMLAKERKQKGINFTSIFALLLMILFFGSTGFYLVTMILEVSSDTVQLQSMRTQQTC
jgi:hypothetical protein